MSETLLMWLEIGFDLAYLITIWALLAVMYKKRNKVMPANKKVAGLIRWMFLFLAIGDTGHVGFRVLAYTRGPLENSPLLVGLGSLATAYTVTLFYMIFVTVWRERFNKPASWFTWLLLIIGILRMIIMALPGNQWGQVFPPQPMGILRNIPLMIQGLGILILILWSSVQKKDKTFIWIGCCIFLSFLFYTPVIFFVNQIPLLGMLMMPKTMAYLAIAFIALFSLYPKNQRY
jgi:hypothetical protein